MNTREKTQKTNKRLLDACKTGDLDSVSFALTKAKHKADIEAYGQGFASGAPLGLACVYGQIEVVKYLLTSAELTVKASLVRDNDDNQAPLSLACLNSHIDIIDYLVVEHRVEPQNIWSSAQHIKEYVESLRSSRDLKLKLEKTLEEKPEPIKKRFKM